MGYVGVISVERGEARGHLDPKRAPCTKVMLDKFGTRVQNCVAWVRREQKAAAKGVRVGAHFTQVFRFSDTSSGPGLKEARSSLKECPPKDAYSKS
jgi:hypothetical protein